MEETLVTRAGLRLRPSPAGHRRRIRRRRARNAVSWPAVIARHPPHQPFPAGRHVHIGGYVAAPVARAAPSRRSIVIYLPDVELGTDPLAIPMAPDRLHDRRIAGVRARR